MGTVVFTNGHCNGHCMGTEWALNGHCVGVGVKHVCLYVCAQRGSAWAPRMFVFCKMRAHIKAHTAPAPATNLKAADPLCLQHKTDSLK